MKWHKYYAKASQFYIITTLCVCLSVSEGKHRPLFAHTDLHKTSCNTQQLSVQRARVKLIFTVQDGQFSISDTVCHVRIPVSDISKSLPNSLVKRRADCGTAGHCCVLLSEELFQYTAVQ